MSQDNFIPIIIGNCNPFRIIARDIDKWNPSLDEINTLSYDYHVCPLKIVDGLYKFNN